MSENDLIRRKDVLAEIDRYRSEWDYAREQIVALPADPAVQALVEALRASARQHRVIAGMDLMGASAVAYNAARDAEAALAAFDKTTPETKGD